MGKSRKHINTAAPILISILILLSGCIQPTDHSRPQDDWDETLTVKQKNSPYKKDGKVFKIKIRYEENRIVTSEGHILKREPISTDKQELKSLAGRWFDGRGYFVSTYGPEAGDTQMGGWIYTGVPLDPENYSVIDPRPNTPGYRYFSTALYLGTFQEFDTDDDGKIDVWSVTLREDPLTRKGQLEYAWDNSNISRINIEYPNTRIDAPEDRLRSLGINSDEFQSPWNR